MVMTSLYSLYVAFADGTTWDILIQAVNANAVCTWIEPHHEIDRIEIVLVKSAYKEEPDSFLALVITTE